MYIILLKNKLSSVNLNIPFKKDDIKNFIHNKILNHGKYHANSI